MFDEISRFEAVPICEGLDLICFQIKIEEAECWGERRDELIFNAISFSEFIIILEESFDSDLFLPDFSSDTGLYIFNRSDAIDRRDYVYEKSYGIGWLLA